MKKMNKKNNKGFMLSEILIVSVVIMVIFMAIFYNYLPTAAEFEKRFKYNDVSATYAAFYMRRMYLDETVSLGTSSYITLVGENEICQFMSPAKQAACDQLVNALEIEEMILTTNETITLKTSYTGTELNNYIDYLSNYAQDDSIEEYRILIKTKSGYATSDFLLSQDYQYSGTVQKYKAKASGYYKVEAWGASGGSFDTVNTGGLGGYTKGTIYLTKGQELNLYVGSTSTNEEGGWNGGGYLTTGQIAFGRAGGGSTSVSIAGTQKYQYIRDYVNGSTANAGDHWIEIQAFDANGNNIALNKQITSDGTLTNQNYITDGDYNTVANWAAVTEGGLKYVEINLGAEYEISSVKIWHYYGDDRTYYNTKTVLYNNNHSVSKTLYDSAVTGTYQEKITGKAFMPETKEAIMVAGGGGGSNNRNISPTCGYGRGDGGNGGGLVAQTGETTDHTISGCTYGWGYGTGGNQTSGGSGVGTDAAGNITSSTVTGYFGYGSNSGQSSGGGGYYGGGNAGHGGAGGGSSYISGYAGTNSITSLTSLTPTNNTRHYSGKYFLNGEMQAGVNYGDGSAKVTYMGDHLSRSNTKLNNVKYIKDCVGESTINAGHHWIEIQAIKNGTNIAYGQTASITGTIGAGTVALITDGNINTSPWLGTDTAGDQCVTVTLDNTYDLDEIGVWHYYGDGRTYYNNVTSVSANGSNWTEVINQVVPESSTGKHVSAYEADSYAGYIGSGLQVLYDGISNTGTTHNASATTWKNLASSSYTGTVTAGAWGTNYLTLDGSTSWVNIGVLNNTTPTIDVLFSVDQLTAADQFVVSNQEAGGYGIWVSPTPGTIAGTGYISGGYRAAASTFAPTANTIYKATMTYDGTDVKLYINGVLNKTLNYPGTISPPTTTTPLMLGNNPTTTGASSVGWLDGNIYGVRVYSRALTPTEVYHNYQVDKARYGI